MGNIKKFLIFFLLILLCGGCGTQASSKSDGAQPAGEEVKVNPRLAAEIKEAAQTVQGVSASTSVVVDKNISTAIKVRGLQRLRLESIKKEVHNKIKEKAPQDYQVYLTADKKLFQQLQLIEKQITEEREKIAPDLAQKVRKINDVM